MVCRVYRPCTYRRTAQRSHNWFPTCRRLPPDFALFPSGYRDSFLLTVVPHQKARSRPHVLSSFSAPTRWGTGAKNLSDIRVRTNSHRLGEDDAFYIAPNSDRLEKARVRHFSSTQPRDSAATSLLKLGSSGFKFSRHFPVGSHPKAFANGSLPGTAIVNAWHRCGVSPLQTLTTTGSFRLMAGGWRLNLQS